MVNSGLDEIQTTALGGVEKMLNEKKFPENFYLLGMVADELQLSLKYMDQADELY